MSYLLKNADKVAKGSLPLQGQIYIIFVFTTASAPPHRILISNLKNVQISCRTFTNNPFMKNVKTKSQIGGLATSKQNRSTFLMTCVSQEISGINTEIIFVPERHYKNKQVKLWTSRSFVSYQA